LYTTTQDGLKRKKTTKTIKFDGTKEHYTIWEFQMRMFLEELERGDTFTLKTADDDTKKMNRKAYMKLALACDDAISHQLVKKSHSKDYPHGDASAAWSALQSRWAPKKEINKQTVIAQLFSSKLEDVSMDPETWIIELQELQVKMSEMKERVSDGILIGHILGNLPKEYENEVTNWREIRTKLSPASAMS
jgi:hypothetical protein